jgi:hypothetical protein
MMKHFIATLALASAIALPAVAQTYDQPARPAARLAPAADAYGRDAYARDAFARGAGDAYARDVYADTYGRYRSANPAFDVYQDGQYVGSDPDPRVRTMMQNDRAMLGND